MKEITFTPTGFEFGQIYDAKLILGSTIVATILNLVENTPYTFEIVIPGTYILSVTKRSDSSCIFSQVVQALFPITTHTTSGVNCTNNTYTFEIVLTNPVTAGNNVQYGWSLLNDCSSVSNWSFNSVLTIPADDVMRYFFVRNSSQACCNFIDQNIESPCVVCDLEVTNISFVCNG